MPADGSGDRESGRNRQTQPRHLGQIRAFPAEFVGETRVPVRSFRTEPVDPSWHGADISAQVPRAI
jgi:hypothetical protein